MPRERLRFVVNRADSKVELAVEDIERLVGIRVDGRIPSSPLVAQSINRGRLLWLDQRRSDVAKGIQVFADKLRSSAESEQVVSTKRRLWARGS